MVSRPTTRAAQITLPDAGKRFISMQIIDEDEYTPPVTYGPEPVRSWVQQRQPA
ncbi:MAG TPA: hypothetical protein PKB14_06410 [Rubrivivax sp.]|nr:hypothetical protein [Rubrivivax sp.]